jgi:hypothetical protein
MGTILLIASILLALFGGYSWFVLGELNGFQKGCYTIGVLLVAAGYFALTGPHSMIASSIGCLLILVPCYNSIREYMP